MKLFEFINQNNTKKIKIFGVNIYKKYYYKSVLTRRYLYVYTTKQGLVIKKYYFLGIPFKKKVYLENYIETLLEKTNYEIQFIKNTFYNLQVLTKIQQYHQDFDKYKRIYKGRDVVLFATGPTVKDYVEIKDAIKVGVNGAVRLENLNLDYLFLTDNLKADPTLNDDIDKYKPNTCKKFYAVLPQRRGLEVSKFENSGSILPKNFIESNATPFLLEDVFANKWAIDIATEPFGDFGGSVFSALQFILYTYPKRIFIVGCDCSADYAYKTNYKGNNSTKIRSFKKFKDFASQTFPEIEVYSINPVGLKGMFYDLYTNENGDYVTEQGHKVDIYEDIVL